VKGVRGRLGKRGREHSCTGDPETPKGKEECARLPERRQKKRSREKKKKGWIVLKRTDVGKNQTVPRKTRRESAGSVQGKITENQNRPAGRCHVDKKKKQKKPHEGTTSIQKKEKGMSKGKSREKKKKKECANQKKRMNARKRPRGGTVLRRNSSGKKIPKKKPRREGKFLGKRKKKKGIDQRLKSAFHEKKKGGLFTRRK